MKRVFFTLGLASLLAGCGSVGPEQGPLTELQEHQTRWETLGPASYTFAVERLCFCAVESRGPVRISVENGVAVERVYVDTGLVVPTGIADQFPTVDGLFELLRSAIDADAHEVRVTYDPTLGVPIDFWIDYIEMAADEELGMQLTEAVAPIP